MSMNDHLVGVIGCSIQESQEEIKNNNKCAEDSLNGDANANQIEIKHGRFLEDIGNQASLVSHIEEQDKIIIWGTASQYDDPELAEFEMLECQELKAYLVETEDSNLKDEGVIPGTLANNTAQAKVAIPKFSQNDASQLEEQESSHKSVSKEAEASMSRAENSSDNDVFVTCYSTMSSLASQSCLTTSDKSKSSPHIKGCQSADVNFNTTALIEESVLEVQKLQTAETIKTSDQLKNGGNEFNLNCTNAKVEHNNNNNKNGIKDDARDQGEATEEQQLLIKQECKDPNAQTTQFQQKPCQPFGSDDTSISMTDKTADDFTQELKGKQSQREETQSQATKSSKSASTEAQNQCVVAEPKMSLKQALFERTESSSPSSLERPLPWCNSSNPATHVSSKTSSPKQWQPSLPENTYSTETPSQEPSGFPQRFTSGLKPPSKSYFSSGIPKPIPPQQPAKTESEATKSSSPQRPKNVRPKIITYIRKNSQVKPNSAASPYGASTLPSRATPYSSTTAPKDQKVGVFRGSPQRNSSNIPFEKYNQELHKSGYNCSSGLMVSGIKLPSHTVSHKMVGKSESFHRDLPDKYLHEVGRGVGAIDVAGVYRLPKTLRPQLGLGAVTRQPTTRTRMLMSGQRSASPLSLSAPMGLPAYCYQDPTAADSKKPLLEVAPKSLLPKSGQSGLRPPGFSSLPTARLAAFGFVRSVSVTSVSSNQSSDSNHSSPCRLQNTAAKEFQRDEDPHHPVSSPKRFATVSPKPHSPVRQKSCVARLGGRVEGADAERECLAVQGLKDHCEKQALQIIFLQGQLRKTSICMDVLAITTQHFFQKSNSGVLKERELSLELSRIRDEVVVSVGQWELLQVEKAELECSFKQQLRELKETQEKELQDLQERLRDEQQKEIECLQQKQSSQLEQLRSNHQQQVEEMTENHEAAMHETDVTHNGTLATLQEEHARTVKNLKMAHEQQKKSLEEEFEKLRLSLQDQVDTLTFQNQSLRDRAKRFEEALRRSTDEQVVEALAPYQHIEEDLKSLKEVLEMKNHQIHEQELKISELEKLAQKNALLEERVQVLQQQNEDLKVRIDLNLATSRQLSEANANLQENVEKESNEKKRLSRTNEELLWRLQTGELSPRMSPNQSPLHRPSSGPGSPSNFPPFPR